MLVIHCLQDFCIAPANNVIFKDKLIMLDSATIRKLLQMVNLLQDF